MGRGRRGDGVDIRGGKLRVRFTYRGERCFEMLDLSPTAPNLRHARKLASTIRLRIEAGTFVYGEFFPDSARSALPAAEQSFTHFARLWLDTKGRSAEATKYQYRMAVAFWKRKLAEKLLEGNPDLAAEVASGAKSLEDLGGARRVADIPHVELAALVGSHKWPSAKLCNNYLIALRGPFGVACKAIKALEDPTEGIENSEVQETLPDPFELAEVEKILADMAERYDEQVWNYFEFSFFAGMRPEEQIALRWTDIDFGAEIARVERAKTFRGGLRAVKNYSARDVELDPRALAALVRQKKHTFMHKAEVFFNPVTGKPWHDERSQREHYWIPALRRLKMRHRRPYQARHTYASAALMAGVNPAYAARQLGHSPAVFFKVYARWIDRADKGREKAKLAKAFAEFGPELVPKRVSD